MADVELDVMNKLAGVFAPLAGDEGARARVLAWAIAKYGPKGGASALQPPAPAQRDAAMRRPAAVTGSRASPPAREKIRRNKSGHREPERLEDLPLKAEGKIPSLVDFAATKKPKGTYEHNALVVYYLMRLRKRRGISMDHVYTALRELRVAVPRNFHQNLIDTARRSHLLDIRNLDDITLTVTGENLVETELPRQRSR